MTLICACPKIDQFEKGVKDSMKVIKNDGYEELGFAKIDHDRKERVGVSEVVFCEGKQNVFLKDIYCSIYKENGEVLGTRASKEQYELLKKDMPDLAYNQISRILKIEKEKEKIGNIVICTAGTADIPVAEEAAETAEFFGSYVERIYDVGVAGIHRILSQTQKLEKADCIIVVAGMEGALASVVAGLSKVPVIAVPTSVGYGTSFGGVTALLSMLNSCANGISVVNIDNGYGAGYMANQINQLANKRMDKLEKLKNKLKALNKVAIAYSGGIDSTFLLYVANQVLPKENVIAIIANGNMIARKDYREAIEFVKENDFQYKEIEYYPLDIKEFKQNQKNRCYHCKKDLMTRIKNVAEENGFEYLLDGENMDDLEVYRPGSKATKEIGISSPLADVKFKKEEIRQKAKELKIQSWNKPSNSCLATRFPYNTVLTEEKLKKVELSEAIIKEMGIQKVRVREQGDIARIEVEKQDFEKILKEEGAIQQIKELGFQFVTLDLMGLKSGSFD